MDDAPRLLSGGNPQIPKGEGEEPVRAYLSAMPGWKRAVGEQLDRLITQSVPGVSKAVKWNQPLYGTEPGSWFLTFRCFDRYVKVTFYRGTSLDPVPAEESKHPEQRHHHIHEGESPEGDETFAAWVRQASKLPGEKL